MQTIYFQKLLNRYATLKKLPIGFVLQVDGAFGRKSIAAMQNFQRLEKLPITNEMDKLTHSVLTKAVGLNCWEHSDVNCWIDSVGTRGENKYRTKLKKFIVLHHTVSGGSPFAVKSFFNDKGFGTQFILGSQGDFVQCYTDYFNWSWHLNVNASKGTITGSQEKFLAENSVAVEVCNFGQCDFKNGKFYNAYDREIDESLLIDYRTIYGNNYKFRGGVFFEKYTNAQIESLKLWIIDMLKINGLNLKNDDRKIDESWFNFNPKAYQGQYVLFNHTNVRRDKSDMHPQPELIEMLKDTYTQFR